MIICHLERLTEWCLNGCVNNHHLQATMAQLRGRGQKQLCQREKNEGGEEKVGSVKNGALKGPRNDKGREWGGRKDNVKGRGRNNEACRQEGKRRTETWAWHSAGGNSWWELTGTGEKRRGTVCREGFPLPPQWPRGNDLQWYNGTIKRQRGDRAEGRWKKRSVVLCRKMIWRWSNTNEWHNHNFEKVFKKEFWFYFNVFLPSLCVIKTQANQGLLITYWLTRSVLSLRTNIQIHVRNFS